MTLFYRGLVRREFRVNDFITLRLIKDKTYIFVKDELFRHCKYLLIDIPRDKFKDFKNIESIDDATLKLDHALEKSKGEVQIPAETEFWGHCSNLQVWAENQYDTRLLHSNIAFPLLKKLADVGDPFAKRVFKEEIAIRFSKSNESVIKYLIHQNYLDYFNKEEISAIKSDLERYIVKQTKKKIGDLVDNHELESFLEFILLDEKNLSFYVTHPFHLLTEYRKNIRLGLIINNSHIKGLIMRNCGLKEISRPIINLKKLKSLYLTNNSLKHISNNILDLTELKQLFMDGNQLNSIPNSINQLNKLKKLNLDHNSIKKLPKGLTQLPQLESLSLWNNLIFNLPNKLGNLKNLKILGLSNNKLKLLSSSISQLTHLKTLDLSNNQLTAFPEILTGLGSLEYLWLNNNQLESLPDSILNMKSLKEFYLINNPLNNHSDVKIRDILNQLKSNGTNVRI